MTGGVTEVRPIDPFAPTVGGAYEDRLVTVRAGRQDATGARTVRTAHFDLSPVDGRVCLTHDVPASRIDDDLAGLLAEELFGPGWLRGVDLFERVFTGVVRTSAPDPMDGWMLFYTNTIRRLEQVGGPVSAVAGHGSIEAYAPVHDHALELLAPGSVLELGCCFGFLSLRTARAGRPTTASDVSHGTVRLLATVAPLLGAHLETLTADAARVPAPDGAADTVLAVHLLEHLEPAHGDRVVAEAVRLASRRVVVAVPLEEEADETYGHVRTVGLDDLRTWGRASGRTYDVHEHHGGWLVIDR